MPTFPLLRLPGLVLCEVFKSLNIEEKIKLSLCSKKIFTQIINCQFYSQKVIVGLDIRNQHIEVTSENIRDAFEIINCSYTGTINNPDIQQCRIEEHTVPVISFAKGITAFWEDAQEGFLSVIRPVFPSWPQKITIINSDWFTLESFLECPCTTIALWNPTLGNKDLDVVLRNWKTGGFPNLERLEIRGHRFTTNGTTILGMNLEDLDGKDIQTDDGSKEAIIQLGYRRIDMTVTPF